MLIVMIAPNDPAGTAICLRNAINKYTPHQCRLITTEIRYNFYFPKDLHIPWLKNYDEVEYLLKKADVLHLHMWVDDNFKVGPFLVGDFINSKKVVHHHHGEPAFRANPYVFRQKEQKHGRRAIVSTPDLLRHYPDALWLPNTVPLTNRYYQPLRNKRPSKFIIVGHSPTKKELKNTAEFIEITNQIDHGVRPLIIENTLHRRCLELKRSCDIFFDHMQGYYGVSSLEALSQGVPTIAGLDEWNIEHIKNFAQTDKLPWVIARNKYELKEKILELAGSEKVRKEIGRFSREWMQEHWTEQKIARLIIKFYESL